MNNKISVRSCKEYDLHEVFDLISDIYKKTDGPEVKGKNLNPERVLENHLAMKNAAVSTV